MRQPRVLLRFLVASFTGCDDSVYNSVRTGDNYVNNTDGGIVILWTEREQVSYEEGLSDGR